jgi:hypothetical protein
MVSLGSLEITVRNKVPTGILLQVTIFLTVVSRKPR